MDYLSASIALPWPIIQRTRHRAPLPGSVPAELCGQTRRSGPLSETRSDDAETKAEAAFASTAVQCRRRLDYHQGRFEGPAYDWLLGQAADARFFLLGEEHGIAENARLAAQLFRDLAPNGYSKLAVEISPPMATELDRAVTACGMDELRRLLLDQRSHVAFFGLKEEAELLAAAAQAVPGGGFLWGVDYEVGAERHLIDLLRRKAGPEALPALDRLETASTDSWRRYGETHNPQFIFSFCGDPALVRAVRDVWPDEQGREKDILETLEETLEINRLWVAGDNWRSNQRRSSLLRRNFARQWNIARRADPPPRVFVKLGASHLVRGVNWVGTFDLGSMIPELAEAEGERAFSLLVLAGEGCETSNFDPVSFSYRPGHRDQYQSGMATILSQAWSDAFTLFPTEPLRALASSPSTHLHPHLIRAVHGFDAILVMSGSTPSSSL